MPERPFKVRLVLLDTEYAGKRFRVDVPRFVLGRHDDCDLQLQSSSLSRHHCEIVMSDETLRVLVRDLNSRNGTFVNDRKLSAGERVPLFHHDVLRMGRLSFRLSIKHSLTGEPMLNQEACAKDPLSALLSELDEMVDDPSFGTGVKATGLLAVANQDSSVTSQEALPIVEEPTESTADPNSETVQITDTVAVKKSANTEQSDENHVEAEKAIAVKVKNEPMKLPEHLRRRSVDSQAAATEALKRLFSGGY